MRVISGLAKGRKLFSPNTMKVRPATDKVKGAVFNILGKLDGATVLDLFAGTGSMGIEALSRGCAHAVFVEADRMIAGFIQKNLDACRFLEISQLLVKSVETAIPWLARQSQKFDLVFIDPPYDQDLVNPSLSLLQDSSLLCPETILVVEHSPREPIRAQEKLEIFDERRYGQTLITFLKPKSGNL